MVTDNQNLIWTTMTIQKDGVKAVTGRNGEPEYELKVRWEWTSVNNMYGDTTYVRKDICPEVITAGTYTVLARRGELKTNKQNELHDGSHRWMYRWRIAEWEGIAVEGVTTAPPQAAPAPAPQPTPQAPVVSEGELTPMETGALIVAKSRPDIFAGIDQTQMRIMRQATLKCASWLMVPVSRETIGVSTDEYDIGWITKITEEMSELFMEYVITGKIYEDIPEDAEDLLNEEF